MSQKLTPYRSNALVISQEKKITIGGIPAPKPHVHEAPGFFRRLVDCLLFGKVYYCGSIYRCSCGIFFRRENNNNVRLCWEAYHSDNMNLRKEWVALGGSLMDGETIE